MKLSKLYIAFFLLQLVLFGGSAFGLADLVSVGNTVYLSDTSLQTGDSLTASVNVRNQGDQNAGGFTVSFTAISKTSGSTQYNLGKATVIALGKGVTTVAELQTTIPSSIPDGDYYIWAIIDDGENVVESDETNNPVIDYNAVVNISNLPPGPDLTDNASHTVSVSTIEPGGALTVSTSVINQGGVSAGGFKVSFYLSSDNVINTTDILLGSETRSSLSSESFFKADWSGNLPNTVTVRSWYIGAIIDVDGSVAEVNEQNNIILFSQKLTVQAPEKPDLTDGGSWQVSPTKTIGKPFSISHKVSNPSGLATGTFTIKYYLSTDATISSSDTLLGSKSVASLAANTNQSLTLSTNIPQVNPGNYYLGIIIDSENTVDESNEGNNSFYIGPLLIDNNVTIVAGSGFNGTISPEGFIYVPKGGNKSFTAAPDSGYIVDKWLVDGTIVQYGGSTYTLSNLDDDHTVDVDFKLAPPALPDLTDVGTTYWQLVKSTINSGEALTFGHRIQNADDGDAGSFKITYFLSDDTTITISDTALGAKTVNSLSAQTYVSVAMPTVHIGLSGKFYLGWIIDYEQSVSESNEGNNTFFYPNLITIVASDHIVNASSGPNGNISPSGDSTVADGGNINFIAGPDTGYVVDNWSVDGTLTQQGGTSFTLSNVTQNRNVSVTFKEVVPPGNGPELTGTGYQPGSSVVFQVKLPVGSPDSTSGFAIELDIPSGWSYYADTSEALVKPVQGDLNKLSWAWLSLSSYPYTFTVTLLVPGDSTGQKIISGKGTYSSPSQTVEAFTNDLILEEVSYHSADINQSWSIEITEVLGVINLFNYRENNTRLGTYHCNGTGGYASGPGSTSCLPHSSDFNPLNWKIEITEVLRLIQFFNYRENNTRLGTYHLDSFQVDGYAPGPSTDQVSVAAYKEFAAGTAVPIWSPNTEGYDANGGQLLLTIDLNYTGAPGALGMQIDLPEGWSYGSDTTNAEVKPVYGDLVKIDWAWITVPLSGTAVTVTLNYPSGLSGIQTLSGRIYEDQTAVELPVLTMTKVGESQFWAGLPVDMYGNADTGSWMGWLYIQNDPWIWSYSLNTWLYIDPSFGEGSDGAWIYVFRPN